ncbi:MAG: PASTA domain-containing protein [Armatimonadota bacterium]
MTPPLTDVVELTPSMRRAYVLFMDIVGFSRLPTDHQVAAQKELAALVQNTSEIANQRPGTDDLIMRPTGDGMALLFFRDLLSPLRCALQIHSLLQSDAARIRGLVGAPLKLRMGIHAGEVTIVPDVNGHTDAAGDGIITAQRVMDMGDADHILLSSEVAKVLLNMDPWARYITHLGEVRVKHGVMVDLYNLYGRLDGPFCGNPGTPRRVAEDGRARNREARAARPKLRDILLPYRRTIVTWCVLIGLWYGANYHYKVNPAPYKAAFGIFKARVMPKVPKFVKAYVPKDWGGDKVAPIVQKPKIKAPPVEKVVVPSLVGKETHDADVLLQEAGLGVKTVLGELSKYPQNTVYDQKPKPGKKVLRESVVVVYVSRGLKGGAGAVKATGGNAPDFDPDKDTPDLPKGEDPGDGN